MTEPAALQKLLTWLSPAFPVGAFAWSAGLESAIAEKHVTDSESLQNWLEGALAHGGIRTDAILLAHAWRAIADTRVKATPLPTSPTRGEVSAGGLGMIAPQAQNSTLPLVERIGEGVEAAADAAIPASLSDLADLAIALTPARERLMEINITGDSFAAAARAWPSDIYARLPDSCPYPIAVGAIAAAHGIGLDDTLLGFLTAAVHGQISVAVRLVPLGQTDGLRVMAALEPKVAALAGSAAQARLADLGSIAYAADIAQMRHETLEPRIFRS